MAVEITWPAALDYSAFALGLDGAADVDHVSAAGRVSTLERTAGAWRGSFVLDPTNNADHVRLSARFITDMFSAARFCAIPLAGVAAPPETFTGVTIDGAPATVAGRVQYALDGTLTDLTEGDHVTVADRLFMVSKLTGQNVVLMPEIRTLADDAAVTRATTIRVVKDPAAGFAANAYSPDFSGPWAFAFREYLP